MRTILFATERVTGSTVETYYFIAVLLVFALAASGYVLYEGLYGEQATGGGGNDDDDEHVTRTTGHFKLFLHCTMIITSVVRSNSYIVISSRRELDTGVNPRAFPGNLSFRFL